MDNASKAIIIAVSILIGIIVISLFYYVFGQASNLMVETQTENYEKQLNAFNSAFEAYNKKVMYGADIISVLNQAINNNELYDISDYAHPKDPDYLDFYVNVVFTYKEGWIDDAARNPENLRTVSLKENYGEIEENFLKRAGYKSGDKKNGKRIDIFDFKSAVFRCKEIKYIDPTKVTNPMAIGRICELVFVPR